MEYFRKYFVVIVLTAVIGIVWGGILILSKESFTTINPNAQNYTKPLNPTFDQETLDSVSERIKTGFAIQPLSFFEMEQEKED